MGLRQSRCQKNFRGCFCTEAQKKHQPKRAEKETRPASKRLEEKVVVWSEEGRLDSQNHRR